MKNIELKVKIDSPNELTSILKKNRARYKGELRQIDTYYKKKFDKSYSDLLLLGVNMSGFIQGRPQKQSRCGSLWGR